MFLINLYSDLGGLSFYEDATGKYVVGADSVPKKLGSEEFTVTHTISFDTYDQGGTNHATSVRFYKNKFTKKMTASVSGYAKIYVDGRDVGTSFTITNSDSYQYIELRGYSPSWSNSGKGNVTIIYGNS